MRIDGHPMTHRYDLTGERIEDDEPTPVPTVSGHSRSTAELAEECRRLAREARERRKAGTCSVCDGATKPGYGDHPSCNSTKGTP